MTQPRFFITPLIAFASRRAIVVPRSTTKMFATSTSLPPFGNPNFGLTKTLSGRNLRQAVLAVETELKKVGFGVLTTIDMKETMHTKIGVDLERPYVILGACNPKVRSETTSIVASYILSTCEVMSFHTLCLLCTDQHFSFVFSSKLAYKALQAIPAVGLLLPCNIVVTEDANENAVVSVLSPLQLFAGIVQEGSEEMQPLAQEVQDLMEKVIEAL
jgi:uncharacterized protein (DUF302 family)